MAARPQAQRLDRLPKRREKSLKGALEAATGLRAA